LVDERRIRHAERTHRIESCDPDGLALELVAHTQPESASAWEHGPIPPEHAIRGLHSVTLTEPGYEHTAELLTGTLGFRLAAEQGDRFRFATGDGGAGSLVDVLCRPEAPHGLVAAGTVHHIAWRTPGEAEQIQWRNTLLGQGLNVTPIIVSIQPSL
jgi:glyoxalase family protein